MTRACVWTLDDLWTRIYSLNTICSLINIFPGNVNLVSPWTPSADIVYFFLKRGRSFTKESGKYIQNFATLILLILVLLITAFSWEWQIHLSKIEIVQDRPLLIMAFLMWLHGLQSTLHKTVITYEQFMVVYVSKEPFHSHCWLSQTINQS